MNFHAYFSFPGYYEESAPHLVKAGNAAKMSNECLVEFTKSHLMGVRCRMHCHHLSAKLLQIREALKLSQTEQLHRLGVQDRLIRANISSYEKGRTEPPLPVLLGYARLANVPVETLIDDQMKLPKKLPANSRRISSVT